MTTQTTRLCRRCSRPTGDPGAALCVPCWDAEAEAMELPPEQPVTRRLRAIPAPLSEHGSHVRAAVCTDDCRLCAPVRSKQRAVNALQRERWRGISRRGVSR